MGTATGYAPGGVAARDEATERGPGRGESAHGPAEAAGGSAVLDPAPRHSRVPGPALMRVGRLDPVVARVGPGGLVPHWAAQARVGRRLRIGRARTVTDVAAGTRRCGVCAVWLPAEAFYHNVRDGLLGRDYRCKACRRGKSATGATNGNPSEGTMGVQVVRPGRHVSTTRENQVRFDHHGFGLYVPDELARAVGIDRRVVVLWDAGTRRLALRPAGADDEQDGYLTSAVGRQRRLSSTMAFRLAGVTRTRSCPARVEDGMVVVDVGAPDAEEAAA